MIELEQVSCTFRQMRKAIRAVDGVSLSLKEREILCLVGESGCGKTTTGKIAAGLQEVTEGRVLFDGKPVTSLQGADYLRFRRAVQLVHQDPYASLNPFRTVFQTLSAPLLHHKICTDGRSARRRAAELLELVDLTPADETLDKYPHQLSGGQRQRVAVARALTVNPRFIVADEAVAMVDVSIRASLLNMLRRLNQEMGVAFLFITHDLALARYFAWEGRIGVMYLGRMVELRNTPQLLERPLHPYTAALLSAVPEPDPALTRSKQRLQLRSDEVPSLLNLPPGCRFHPRCPIFEAGRCDVSQPSLEQVAPGQWVACHLARPPQEVVR